MKKLHIILVMVCAFFAVLDAVLWIVNNSSSSWIIALMLSGGILILLTLIGKIKRKTPITILALSLICGSSFLHSFFTGTVIINQHIVRVAVSAFVVYLTARNIVMKI